jgi:hypothetical protein
MARGYRDRLEKLFEADPGKRSSQEETGARVLMSLALAEALEAHAAELKAATENILNGMNRHAAALTKAAEASDTYSRRLVWATSALVLVAVVQIIVTLCRG